MRRFLDLRPAGIAGTVPLDRVLEGASPTGHQRNGAAPGSTGVVGIAVRTGGEIGRRGSGCWRR
jgi:hypothetical protein